MTDREITTPEQLRAVMGSDFTFSAQQFAAITAPLGPAVVIAGAGSGKTAVMAARVVWLVATGRVAPHEVLGLTFTTKATAELAHRIRSSLRAAGLVSVPGDRAGDRAGAGDEIDEVEEPTVSTYHSYAANLLSEHGLRIGHEPDARLIADASRYQLAARAVQRHTGAVQHLTDSPTHVVQSLLGLDAEMSEHLVDPADVRAYDVAERPLFVDGMAEESRVTYRECNEKAILAIDRRAELLDLVAGYRALKAHLGLVDFSDQIALAARLAEQCPEVGEVERGKFKVVLLDEYQDTSIAQVLMLSRLYSGPDAAAGRGHPVTAVGDPNQAIYGWRGASVSNILDFGSDFPTLDGDPPTYPLTVNRRSDRRILHAANHLAAALYADHAQVGPLEAKPEAPDGSVTVALHATYDHELEWLAEQVVAARTAMETPRWNEIGVLTRNNAHAAHVFDALTRREIPVEIVGLKGLLRLPEIAEVVATLSLVSDVTANPALLTLLAGPRWAIGPRDLALLGRRARALAGPSGRRATDAPSVADELAAAVDGSDPTEIAALGDALADPGPLPYSAQAVSRFGLLAAELRRLRAAANEPILDLVRRIIDLTGIDIELASSVSPTASARRDNLDLFVQAVAEFQAVDGQVTLPALMAWLEAEDSFGQGLDVATPSEADSVKLLTVHRAKGLEWDVVFLVGVTEQKFPTNQSRSSWLTVPSVMPNVLRGDRRDLPQLGGHRPEDIKAYAVAARKHEATEELRLAYVAWTRARHDLYASAWCWHPSLKRGRGASPYLLATLEAVEGWGGEPQRWQPPVGKTDVNPYALDDHDQPWPMSHHSAEVERRADAAKRLGEAEQELRAGEPEEAVEDLLVADQVGQWDTELTRLLDEARRDRADTIEVTLPSSLSATSLGRLREDPARFAADLARPMPRKPSASARFGTRFHAWVESRFGQQGLIDPDELPGRFDTGIDDEDDLAELIATFESGEFADRLPYAVEAPFALVLDGQVVRGRIDAVYTQGTTEAPGFLLVDWKTNRHESADPLQLAVYRVAWAELHGVDPERVSAAFHYVRTGHTVEPPDLPDRAGLERLLSPAGLSQPGPP